MPGRTIDVPGLRQRSKTLILDSPATPIEAPHFHPIPPRGQTGNVIGPRDVLAVLVQDGGALQVGLNGPHDMHRDLTVSGSLVADPGDGPQRRDAHLLHLLASRELALLLPFRPASIGFFQLPLDVAVEV